MSRVWARVSVFESNLRPLGYFLLVYYGRVVLIVVVLLTGGKQSPSPKAEAWTLDWSLTKFNGF